MKNCLVCLTCVVALFVADMSVCIAATAGQPSGDELTIATDGRTQAVVVVSPTAKARERRAADDLAKYIRLMCGAEPAIADTRPAIDTAMRGKSPLLVLGQESLAADSKLRDALRAVVKKNPHLQSEGIVLRREGNRVYLAGNNDLGHYFAVAELLRLWGCRWYTPTEFGECIPEERDLKVGDLDYAYSSPFEIRSYWISWVGDNTGAEEFRMRNMMTGRSAMPPTGHALGKYTKGLGKGTFSFPITAPETAKHVAEQVEELYAQGKSFSLGMEDGSYNSDHPKDRELMKLQWDKYFLRWSVTDPMLELYNNVAQILQKKHPASKGKIGFLAYANMTIPPVRKMTAERSLYCELAPIDIDPIHGMNDARSPPRQEYRDMMYKWAKVMQGRLCIYDYDQGMLVWRDIPNPSHQAFEQDVQHYRRAGILGVNTESRNAIATTFLNLHIRARLLWNPDEDVDALLDDFYPAFYGPAAEPMRVYWSTIYDAWKETICTEHEHFVAPAVYTPEVMAVLKEKLHEAEKIIGGINVRARALTRNEKLYVDRMRFTRYSHEITAGYMSMVRVAATECDYAKAVSYGERALAVREQLTDTSGIFTTYRNYKVEHRGYAWWPGEVRQYRELLPRIDGTQGLRSDLYAQAQGVRAPDGQSFTGELWYRTDVELTAGEARGAVKICFPGLFNECWLYVNGQQVGYREQRKMYWLNDYRFQWDVDLSGKLKEGRNTLALRCNCEHHFGGMFRRPFLYRATGN